MGSPNSSKPKFMTKIQDMATNLTSALPPGTKSIPDGNGMITTAAAVSQLQAGVKLFSDVSTAKTDYANAVQAKKAGMPALQKLFSALSTYLRITIPGDPAAIASCGVSLPKKKAQLTAAEKAAKAAQAAATRKAHGLQGANQKRKAALASKATTVVLGPNGLPLDGSPLPTPAINAAPAAAPAATGK